MSKAMIAVGVAVFVVAPAIGAPEQAGAKAKHKRSTSTRLHKLEKRMRAAEKALGLALAETWSLQGDLTALQGCIFAEPVVTVDFTLPGAVDPVQMLVMADTPDSVWVAEIDSACLTDVMPVPSPTPAPAGRAFAPSLRKALAP